MYVTKFFHKDHDISFLKSGIYKLYIFASAEPNTLARAVWVLRKALSNKELSCCYQN